MLGGKNSVLRVGLAVDDDARGKKFGGSDLLALIKFSISAANTFL